MTDDHEHGEACVQAVPLPVLRFTYHLLVTLASVGTAIDMNLGFV
jgi:hypothetical protein